MSALYQRAVLLSQYNIAEVSRLVDVKHDDRHIVFLAQRKSGHIHYLKTQTDNPGECKVVEFDGGSVFFRIGAVNPVHAGAFQQDVCIDFVGAKGCGAVGSEKGVSGACCTNNHPTFSRWRIALRRI